jgi:hypothetical protein
MCEVWWSREESETRGESRETWLTVGVQCQGDPVKRHETLGDMEPFQREPSCLYTALFGGHISASHDWTLMAACVSHDLRQLSLPLLGASSRTLVSGDLKGSGKMVGVHCTAHYSPNSLLRTGGAAQKLRFTASSWCRVEGNRPGLAGSLLKEAAETITRAWETRSSGLQASPARSDSRADRVVLH